MESGLKEAWRADTEPSGRLAPRFTEGGCGIDAVHCTSLLKLPQFRCSFLQYRGCCPQLFRTPKLMVWDFVGVRILRCQNLVGAGFILRRPFFVNVGEF